MEMTDLLTWYLENRRDLPWRKHRTPYSTWISEAMLQQTRVTTVLDYYPRFLKRFPDPASLAAASEDEVFKYWEGLGYYSRARNLMRGAAYICEHFDGSLPSRPDLLLEIPGIGPYMSGAIASLAFDYPEPAVDGNCIRIYSRLHALPVVPSEKRTYDEIYSRVKKDMPEENPGDFNEALMDLGSLVCTPKSPRCSLCPFSTTCSAHLLGKETDFPLKKPKKETPVEEHTILKIYAGDRILVRKRPSQGLLAGLFELIDLPGNLTQEEVSEWLLSILGTPAPKAEESFTSEKAPSDPTKPKADIRSLGASRHIFSHLRWNMVGYEIRLSSSSPSGSSADTSSLSDDISAMLQKLGTLVTPEEYSSLAFASALSAYR
ncbi:MAG: A/G-specific adenine glycosylase [Clostridiales bacterium]|nr:A/G-specific adenine glycosylase [Clostridiales bacterium]